MALSSPTLSRQEAFRNGPSSGFFKTCPLSALPADSIDHQSPPNNGKKRRYAPNRRTSLRWVVESIENLRLDSSRHGPKPSAELLMECLQRLVEARTQREIAEIGRELEALNVSATEGVDVQERVIKATALAGLSTLSLDLMDNLLSKGIFPSSMAYNAVLLSLRQAGRVKRVKELIQRLGVAAKRKDRGVDVVAFNTYLASLCDGRKSGKRIGRGTSPLLQAARELLKPGAAFDLCGTEPDVTSYATVLHAAASAGNRTIIDELWREMEERGLRPSLYAYNSLLCAVRTEGQEGDSKAIEIWSRIRNEAGIQPDQYTIDFMLVPLIRSKRMDEAESLLRDFVASRSSNPRMLSGAFEAFLNTLVNDGEVSAAQILFDRYISPSRTRSRIVMERVKPTIRHFNVLLTGYRRAVESNLESSIYRTDAAAHDEGLPSESMDQIATARKQGMKLYQEMLNIGLSPDDYTLTSMMGLAKSSEELSTLVHDAIVDFESQQVSPAVLRAAMKGCGELGDPSSACWFFDYFSSDVMSTTTWNGLLAALAKGSAFNSSERLSIGTSTASKVFGFYRKRQSSLGLDGLLDSMTCPQAARTILVLMQDIDRSSSRPITAPPNSQSYCIVASALQHDDECLGSSLALELFRNATSRGIPADGRFVNAILRCFGDDIDGALSAWKTEIRRACVAHENRARSSPVSEKRRTGKNLIAAYHGLLYVCGRALRPDVALRVVYAMNKEGIEPDEVALNCYQSGKRSRQKRQEVVYAPESASKGIRLATQFESLLVVECSKYDTRDKRRAAEKRVRIIL